MPNVKDNIPADAITIWYKSSRREAEYSIWKRYVKAAGEYIWYWSALGNGGMEGSAEDAAYAAKLWIKEH